ncbi:MAG: AraC family transcriptional regulator, partial [Ilumatobacteraceae bacterium]
MDGVFYCRSELTCPWGAELPPMPDTLFFHVVTQGSCWLIDATGERWRLRQGDLAVLPHGAGHVIVDELDSPAPNIFDIEHDYITPQYAILRHGGGGEQVNMICGGVRFGHPAARSLVRMLPAMIHVDATTGRTEWQWLPTLLALMAAETSETRPGGEAVVTRLSDVLVIQAIRSWIATDPAARPGWLGALQDPRIGHAIAMIHREPERDWSVASLAREVAMSRSSFSARFSELVGESAMQYVTRWRMQLAVDLLGEGELPIAAIADRLGYGSEAAFSRAFKRTMGEPPGAARRS